MPWTVRESSRRARCSMDRAALERRPRHQHGGRRARRRARSGRRGRRGDQGLRGCRSRSSVPLCRRRARCGTPWRRTSERRPPWAPRAGVSSIEHLSGIADAASDRPGRLLAAHDDFLGLDHVRARVGTSRSGAARRGRARTPCGRGRPVPTLALHEAFARLADPDLLRDPALAGVPPSSADGIRRTS